MRKLILPLAICSLLSVVAGFLIGQSFDFVKKSRERSPLFFNGFNMGQPLTTAEQTAIKQVKEVNDGFIKSLNASEKDTLKSIVEKVKAAIAEDAEGKIRYSDILNTEEKRMVKKMRSYRNKNKVEINRKVLGSALSKMKADEIIDLFYGVR